MTQGTLGAAYRKMVTGGPSFDPELIADWEWATVTNISPLRVKRDGDTSASLATPPTLEAYQNLEIGDRVLTIIVKGTLIVLGKYDGVPMVTVPPPEPDVVDGVVADKTYYVKEPNGGLTCRGFHSFPANANNNQTYVWTFPIAFVGEVPHVSITPNTTAPQVVSVAESSLTLTGVTIQFLRSTSAATGVHFQAEGRWK